MSARDPGDAGDAGDARARGDVGRPPRSAAPGHLVGQAEGSVTRVEDHGPDAGRETTLTFRLVGPAGQAERQVELRGSSISGTVRDGDWVEVDERERSARLQVGALLNLTTGEEVRARGRSAVLGFRRLRTVLLVVLLVILLLLLRFALVRLGVVHAGWPFGGGSSDGRPDGGLDPGTTSFRLLRVAVGASTTDLVPVAPGVTAP